MAIQHSLDVETNDVHETEHEQNDNWEWSDAFTEFIHDEIEGRSLKICPGLRPICDVNLDIKHLGDIADSSAAEFNITPIADESQRLTALRNAVDDEGGDDIIYGRVTADNANDTDLYDGYACYGDMFDLPFEDNTFDTIVADPPWLNLSADDRRDIFKEAVRVTKPTGKILYNATWVPEDDHAREFQLRFRQQRDFWGGPSFAAFYRRTARNMEELFTAHEYDSVERYPVDSPFWSEAYPPDALSTDHNTDPKKVSGDPDYHAYSCPMCGCAQLGQLRTEFFESSDGQYDTYQCHNCEFRVHEQEVDALAEALETAAEERGVSIHELDDIDYTPDCIERALDDYAASGRIDDSPLSPDLPWVPTHRYKELSDEFDCEPPADLTSEEYTAVLQLIESQPSVQNRITDDVTELPDAELERRVETLSRAIHETSLKHVKSVFDDQLSESSEKDTAGGSSEPSDSVQLARELSTSVTGASHIHAD